MKRLFVTSAVAFLTTVAFAQSIWKAEDLMMKDKDNKGAAELLRQCVNSPKTKDLAFAYHMLGEANSRIINDEIEKLKDGACDTMLFIGALEDAVAAFTKSHEIAKAEAEAKKKDKIKYLEAFESSSTEKYSGNRKRLEGMLQYYGYAANFMNQHGDREKALEYFIKTLDLPKNPIFTPEQTAKIYKKDKKYYNKIGYYAAMLAYGKKDYDTVLKYVDFAIADSASLRDGYVMKLDAYLAKGDTASWVNCIKQAIHDMPNNVANCTNLLKYYDDHHMVEEAKAMSEELVQKSPESKVAWYTRGCVFMNTLKDYKEARSAFEKALSIDPQFVYAQFNQGCTYVNELMSIKDNLETNRSNVDKYNKDMATARTYYRQALPYFENALVLAPNKPNLWGYNLQTVYYNLQDGAEKDLMVKKEADMKKVVEGELQPEEFIAKYNIAFK